MFCFAPTVDWSTIVQFLVMVRLANCSPPFNCGDRSDCSNSGDDVSTSCEPTGLRSRKGGASGGSNFCFS